MGSEFLFAAPVLTLLVGFLIGRFLRLPRRVDEKIQELPFLGHDHDWHISGKKKGYIWERCVFPDCRAERRQP